MDTGNEAPGRRPLGKEGKLSARGGAGEGDRGGNGKSLRGRPAGVQLPLDPSGFVPGRSRPRVSPRAQESASGAGEGRSGVRPF